VSRPIRVPSYRKHRPSGQAVVTLTGLGGRSRDIYLGPHGSPESHREYVRLIAEWAGTVAGPAHQGAAQADALSVNELLVKFWAHVEQYYVKNGRPTSEQHNYKAALKPLRLLYGLTPAARFTPISLKALRQHYVTHGLARSEVNRRVRLVRSVFRWGVAEGLLPSGVWEALRAVPGLKKGRSEARETAPVRPVADAMIEAVLPHLPPVVADMLRLQRVTGMRPGELCAMRPADIDRSKPVWEYTPTSHKAEHHQARIRTVYLFAPAQSILIPYLDLDPETFCFCPATAETARIKYRSEARVTPLRESHRRRKASKSKARRRRPPGSKYTTASFGRAIDRACAKAYPPPEPLARREDETFADWRERLGQSGLAQVHVWHKAHRFHPHQVRHRAATEFRERYGLEATRALLGHSFAAVSDHYSKHADVAIVTRIAPDIGQEEA
jgi:integrase